MRYHIGLNQIKLAEWGLGCAEGALLDLICSIASSEWAKIEKIEGNYFYFLSRTKVMQELPVVFKKPDTVYRFFKKLHQLGLIEYKKHEGKDYVRLLKKGKSFVFKPSESYSDLNPKTDGFKSENTNNSDLNPSKLGKLSENKNSDSDQCLKGTSSENSDLNPTYNNNTTIDNIKNIQKDLCVDPDLKTYSEKIGKYFHQTSEVQIMRVFGFLTKLKNQNLLEEFKRQASAYASYKNKSGEKVHGWQSFQTDWQNSDWVSKLKTIEVPVVVPKTKWLHKK